MSTVTIKTFHSPTNTERSVSYACLNLGAPNTLLFCYGTSGDSLILAWYKSFMETHPGLCLICVDRWAQGKNVARTGPELLSELSSITLELFDFLDIDCFSIAAHSAGAYQMLDLAQNAPLGRVQHLFPISAHIPAAYTESKIMESMRTMPDLLFKFLTKLDSGAAPQWLEDLVVGSMARKAKLKADEGKFVTSWENRILVSDQLRKQNLNGKIQRDRIDLDYRMGYERIEGVTKKVLTDLFRNCPLDMTWFTSDGDVFFGPRCVERISKEIYNVETEIVNVPGATHADIMLRAQVWNKIDLKLHQLDPRA